MSITKEDVVKFIENMTVLELSQLVKELEEKFGVTAAAPMAMAMMPAAGEAAPVVEEQTEFNVKLTGSGANKIQVIKVVRALTGLGLKEAKDLVDGAPSMLKEGATKEEAADIKAKIVDAGGTVEVA